MPAFTQYKYHHKISSMRDVAVDTFPMDNLMTTSCELRIILPEKTSYYYKNLRFKKENNIMQLKFTMFVIFDICENAQSKEKKTNIWGTKFT